nr:hypothetical protein [Tanacetum cinerariifolium]
MPKEIEVSEEVVEYLSQHYVGDARVALNALDYTGNESDLDRSVDAVISVTIDDAKQAFQKDGRFTLSKCLLLMMYEPKLSMEVSKETRVCSSDFLRHHSSRKKPSQPPLWLVESIDRQDESLVKCSSPTVTTKECDYNVMREGLVQDRSVLHQPGRPSCLFATRQSRATVLEEKLVNTMRYELLVLTRCKSEPMRIVEAKLKQDTCYWKNKLEPPCRASFNISIKGEIYHSVLLVLILGFVKVANAGGSGG